MKIAFIGLGNMGGPMALNLLKAGHTLSAFDLSAEACKKLTKEAAAVQFVMDAFGHLKAIGHNAAAKPLLDKAGVEPDEGVTDLPGFVAAAKKRYWDREPKVRTVY